jgi:hypothetical protein
MISMMMMMMMMGTQDAAKPQHELTIVERFRLFRQQAQQARQSRAVGDSTSTSSPPQLTV